MGKIVLAVLTALLLTACAQTTQVQQSRNMFPPIQTAGDLANACRLDANAQIVLGGLGGMMMCDAFIKGFYHAYNLSKQAAEREMPDICIPMNEKMTEILPKLVPELVKADAFMNGQLARANADLAAHGMKPITEATSAPEGLLIALNKLYACRRTTVVHQWASEYDYGPWAAMRKTLD